MLAAMVVSRPSYAQQPQKGRVETFVFAESKVFPGTSRTVSVYIPAQLDPQKPACVYVQHDGMNRSTSAPRLLDSLINLKLVPVIVGVFVQPGNLSPYEENGRPRPNRSLEYDGLGDSQARFVLEELLPAVSEKYNVRLSDDANDLAIGGMSSGGIAAFNAAWERPGAFSRVYCNSGSFVGFRGGNEYPVLVRKTDPKPIRFFLTVGTNDMKNAGGDWTLSNYQMDKALRFAGYDYKFKVLEGGHVVGYEETFAEAMVFLWRDWPNRIMPGLGAPRVRDVTLPDEGWKKLSGEYSGASTPAFNSRGEVFFTHGRKVMQIRADGVIVERLSSSKHVITALAVGNADELYTLDTRGRIVIYDTSGKSTVFARGVKGDRIVAHPAGGLYISDSRSGAVHFVQKDRKPRRLGLSLINPSALALAPDHWQFAVSERNDHRVYNFEISREGELLNGERFFWLHRADEGLGAGASHMVYDQEGHLIAATKHGIQFSGDEGKVVAILPAPGVFLESICFGGNELSTIYAFCSDGIYFRSLRVHGAGAFTPKMRMKKTPL